MQLELLESFDIPDAAMPPRSTLVSLSPRGLHSPYCESLISYLTRLAGAHVVRPNNLVKEVILPLTDIRIDTSSCKFNLEYSRTINSYTKYARSVSHAIETLTLQKTLTHLTFLPWRDLFDPKGSRLLRDHVGFCPECLNEMEASEDGIYYPLTWYLRSSAICSRHDRRLEDTCPKCGKHQNFVSHHAMLGYCSQCGTWLATHRDLEVSAVMSPITDREMFFTAALEQMISENPSAEQFAKYDLLIERLVSYCEVLTKGNIWQFHDRLGFKRNVIWHWVDGAHRPRIDIFLELCFRLGQMPVQFLTADIPSDFSSHVGHFEISHSCTITKLSAEEHLALKGKLEAILEGTEAPTLISVATLLGFKRRFLEYHFGELARAISEKHKIFRLIRTEEKRATRLRRAAAVTAELLEQQRSITRRSLWAALKRQGLTFADPEIRHVVRDTIDAHYQQTKHL